MLHPTCVEAVCFFVLRTKCITQAAVRAFAVYAELVDWARLYRSRAFVNVHTSAAFGLHNPSFAAHTTSWITENILIDYPFFGELKFKSRNITVRSGCCATVCQFAWHMANTAQHITLIAEGFIVSQSTLVACCSIVTLGASAFAVSSTSSIALAFSWIKC